MMSRIRGHGSTPWTAAPGGTGLPRVVGAPAMHTGAPTMQLPQRAALAGSQGRVSTACPAALPLARRSCVLPCRRRHRPQLRLQQWLHRLPLLVWLLLAGLLQTWVAPVFWSWVLALGGGGGKPWWKGPNHLSGLISNSWSQWRRHTFSHHLQGPPPSTDALGGP